MDQIRLRVQDTNQENGLHPAPTITSRLNPTAPIFMGSGAPSEGHGDSFGNPCAPHSAARAELPAGPLGEPVGKRRDGQRSVSASPGSHSACSLAPSSSSDPCQSAELAHLGFPFSKAHCRGSLATPGVQARWSAAIVNASTFAPACLMIRQLSVAFPPWSISRVINILLRKGLLTALTYPFSYTAQRYHRRFATIP